MYICPVLQLHKGGLVSLSFGDLDKPVQWESDPVETALSWVNEGATRLHVTDIDAIMGTGSNAELVEEIIRRTGAVVHVGGGIRTDEQVRRWLDAGAGRIVLSTAAIWYPEWVSAWAKAHPDHLIVSIDVWKGKVLAEGWKTEAAISPVDLVHAYDGVPLSAIVITDVDRDLDLPESSFALVSKLAEETRTPVIASGLVKDLDDVSTLRYLPNISGAMVGRALHQGSVDLPSMIEVASPSPERVAEFL